MKINIEFKNGHKTCLYCEYIKVENNFLIIIEDEYNLQEYELNEIIMFEMEERSSNARI